MAGSRRSAAALEQRLADAQRANERLASEIEAARSAAVAAQRDAAAADGRRDAAERELEVVHKALDAAEAATAAARQEGAAHAAEQVEALQQRVASLEELQRVAQDTALASEQRLEELEAALREATEQRDAAMRDAAVQAQQGVQRGGEAASPATLPDMLQVCCNNDVVRWCALIDWSYRD